MKSQVLHTVRLQEKFEIDHSGSNAVQFDDARATTHLLQNLHARLVAMVTGHLLRRSSRQILNIQRSTAGTKVRNELLFFCKSMLGMKSRACRLFASWNIWWRIHAC